MVAGITLRVCTRNRVLDRSAYITGILGLPVVYLCDYFISGSSGTAMGGKGLTEKEFHLHYALFKALFCSSKKVFFVTEWSQNGVTVAGGNGAGSGLNQLNEPYGLFVNESGVIYVADSLNQRVVKWNLNASSGELVAGGRGRGNASDQLTEVADVVVDKNGTMYITDHQNRRVQKWFQGAHTGQTILENLLATGIALDDEGSLYVSEWTNKQVRKWRKGNVDEKVILRELGTPDRVFVDRHRTVYVADRSYHQIMKIAEVENQGSVVAGGSQGRGDGQLHSPTSVLVDKSGNVYVTDSYDQRVMCWSPGANAGTLIVGGRGIGSRFDQLYDPHDLAFDLDENLYVLDTRNHRVQKFVINKNLV